MEGGDQVNQALALSGSSDGVSCSGQVTPDSGHGESEVAPLSPGTGEMMELGQGAETILSTALTDSGLFESGETRLLESGEEDENKSSLLGAAFNVSNAALGAGILMFPFLFRQMGLFFGVSSFILAIALMSGTLHILATAAAESKKPNYQEVVAHIISPWAGTAIDWTMGLYLFGCCASYFVVLADMVCAVLGSKDHRTWVISMAALLAAPLMCMKDISKLSATSSFGVFVNFFVALIILAQSGAYLTENGVKCYMFASFDVRAYGTAFSTYCFGLQCHLVFIPVYYSIRRSSVPRMDLVIIFAYTLCFLLYASVGILGYCAFGQDVSSDFLADPRVPNNFWTSTARIGLAIKSFVSYPLLHFPARLCLGDLVVQGNINDNPLAFYGLTLGFLFSTWFIAIAVKDLAQVIDFTSALLGIFQVFIWPGLLLVKLRPGKAYARGLCAMYCFLGILTTVFGLYAVFDPLQPGSSDEL